MPAPHSSLIWLCETLQVERYRALVYALEVILICVRWHVIYPLSLRHIDEIMQERGVFVEYVMFHRWAIMLLPALAAEFRRRKPLAGSGWSMDETYIKV